MQTRKQLIDNVTSFPAYDIWQAKEIYLDATDDLVLDVIHHRHTQHNDDDDACRALEAYNVMVNVNQPSRNIIDREMLLVSVDVDDFEIGE